LAGVHSRLATLVSVCLINQPVIKVKLDTHMHCFDSHFAVKGSRGRGRGTCYSAAYVS